MNWTLCMQTPAGEKYTYVMSDTSSTNAPKYAGAPTVRMQLSEALHWVDRHIDQKFEVNPPLAGDGHWEIHIHKEDQTCPLCQT